MKRGKRLNNLLWLTISNCSIVVLHLKMYQDQEEGKRKLSVKSKRVIGHLKTMSLKMIKGKMQTHS